MVTDRQNDKTTTVTLAAHARRGLINTTNMCINYLKCQSNYKFGLDESISFDIILG